MLVRQLIFVCLLVYHYSFVIVNASDYDETYDYSEYDEIYNYEDTSKVCGQEIQHRGFVNPKIAFGNVVKRHITWPWMISIGYDNSSGYHHLCGGSLIDNKHVLTAAHCFSEFDLKNMSLVLGTLNYTSYAGHRIDRSIKKVHIHPKYNKDHAYFDVAIIEMDLHVEFSNSIYPICIPETASGIDNRVNVGASLAGWGATENFNGEPSTVLRETKMNVFAQSHCNSSWDITSTVLLEAANVDKEIPELFQSNLLCAGSTNTIGNGKACGGDSGSPLMVFDTRSTPPKWIHIGLVHGGVVCSDFYKNLKFPEIFSRTEDSEVLNFIKNVMDGILSLSVDGDDFNGDHFSTRDQESYDDCDHHTLSNDEYDYCITMQKPCQTVHGVPCILPFNFKRKENTKCITTSIGPFCPTQLDSSTGDPVKWGYCNDQCPTEGSEIVDSLKTYEDYDDYDETLPKQCKTLDGIPCKLPFNFKGNEKTKCITTLIGPFCPTQLDSSSGVPVKWGYCNDQCPTEGSEIGKLLENEMQYPVDSSNNYVDYEDYEYYEEYDEIYDYKYEDYENHDNSDHTNYTIADSEATFKTSFTAPQFRGQKRPKPAATTRTRTWTTKQRTRTRATKQQGGPLLKLIQRLFS